MQHWFYEVNPGKAFWARFWLTSDWCLAIMSDFGTYAYRWHPEPTDFRAFLQSCDDGYITRKLAGGEQELDVDATTRNIKERILRYRRERGFSADDAREEIRLLQRCDFHSERERYTWYETTMLPDASEALWYGPPARLQAFMKKCWGPFVEQLKQVAS